MPDFSYFLPCGDRTSCMLVLVYGSPASGKTTLCRALADSLEFAESLSLAFVEAARCGSAESSGVAHCLLCPRHVRIQHICFDAIERDLFEAKETFSSSCSPHGKHLKQADKDLRQADVAAAPAPPDSLPGLSFASSKSSSFTSESCSRGHVPSGSVPLASRQDLLADNSAAFSPGERPSSGGSAPFSTKASHASQPSPERRNFDCSLRSGSRGDEPDRPKTAQTRSFDPEVWKLSRRVARELIEDILQQREARYRPAVPLSEQRARRGFAKQHADEPHETRLQSGTREKSQDDDVHRQGGGREEDVGAEGRLEMRRSEAAGSWRDSAKRLPVEKETTEHRDSSPSPFATSSFDATLAPAFSCPSSSLVDAASSPLLVLLVDDTMHLSSMRKTYFRLAAQHRCAFHQVFLDVPLELCARRNELRFVALPVGRDQAGEEENRKAEAKGGGATVARDSQRGVEVDTAENARTSRNDVSLRQVEAGQTEERTVITGCVGDEKKERNRNPDEHGQLTPAFPPPGEVLQRLHRGLSDHREAQRGALSGACVSNQRLLELEREVLDELRSELEETTPSSISFPLLSLPLLSAACSSSCSSASLPSASTSSASFPLGPHSPFSSSVLRASPLLTSSVHPAQACLLCGAAASKSCAREASPSRSCSLVRGVSLLEPAAAESGPQGERNGAKRQAGKGVKRKVCEGRCKWERLSCRCHSWRLQLREDQGEFPRPEVCARAVAAAFRHSRCWAPALAPFNSKEDRDQRSDPPRGENERARQGDVLSALDLALRRLIHTLAAQAPKANARGVTWRPAQQWAKRKKEFLEECRRRLHAQGVEGTAGNGDGGGPEARRDDRGDGVDTSGAAEMHALCAHLTERFRQACLADLDEFQKSGI
ncbi:hypothetical protein BESB_074410 [Besnoitia besnoiti]|uniref:AAA+ ATPase domain-containing protein n=1 Tax=Besnoitia besnoiti TaxID=94643 RepID=A0A2A9M8Q2_BESBE|nr:uncharacterized protein BESB_074410 [Besnoitia besnoiti]PFH34289.1 hypothetical protein BESB_074410 [Besnoitia besnoiti]